MDAQPTSLITRMFDDIEALDDPRADNARHFLTDILVIAILAVMCGLDDYPGIVEYGRDELDWLKTFLGLPHGIPSVSTFRRLFAALKPAVLLNVMRRWSGELSGIPASCASIDGGSQMILPCVPTLAKRANLHRAPSPLTILPRQRSAPMPGETNLHKTLKKEACRWLYRMGYRCIAAEVRVAPLGIVDAIGTGLFRAYHNYLAVPHSLEQVCFVECKASRADFLRDMESDGQMLLQIAARRDRIRSKPRRRRRNLNLTSLGKFRSCLMCPMANLHYVLAPAGLLKKMDLPPRWGLLALSEAGVNVIVRADWQETAQSQYVESAIARTLTGDIYRADLRAMDSVNREIFAQQQNLAERIRGIRPQIVLAPRPHVNVPTPPPRAVLPRIGWPVGR